MKDQPQHFLKRIIKNPVFRFFVRRSLFIFLTLSVFTVLIFLLPRAVPGNPLALLLQKLYETAQSNPEQLRLVEQRLMNEFGVGKPLLQQFVDFVIRTLKGDLGTSFSMYPTKVEDLIFSHIPFTVGLLLPATIVSWILGNLLGAFAAYRRKTLTDNALLSTFLVLSTTPYYWLAMLLVYYFAVTLHLFPAGGAYPITLSPSLSPTFIVAFLSHYTLPFLSIVISAIGVWAIGMRLMMIYEFGSDHISFAEILGLSDRKIMTYAFRNSMLPQITGLALNIGSMLGGALLTEIVFNYRGTGYLVFRALVTNDYPLIQGIFLILISTLLVATLVVDVIYVYVDPRVRTGYSER